MLMHATNNTKVMKPMMLNIRPRRLLQAFLLEA